MECIFYLFIKNLLSIYHWNSRAAFLKHSLYEIFQGVSDENHINALMTQNCRPIIKIEGTQVGGGLEGKDDVKEGLETHVYTCKNLNHYFLGYSLFF